MMASNRRQNRAAGGPALSDQQRTEAARKAFIDPSVTAEWRACEMKRFASAVKYWDDLKMGGPNQEAQRRAHAKAALSKGDSSVMQMLNDRRLDAHILLDPAQVVRELRDRARNEWETAERDNLAGHVATFKDFTVAWPGTSYLYNDPNDPKKAKGAEMDDEEGARQAGPPTASIKTTMFFPVRDGVAGLSPQGKVQARAAFKAAGLDPDRNYGEIRVFNTFINGPRKQFSEHIYDSSGQDAAKVQMGAAVPPPSDELALAYADSVAQGHPHAHSKPMMFTDPNYLCRTYPNKNLDAAKAHAPRTADVIRSQDGSYTPEEKAKAMDQAKAGLVAYLSGQEPLSRASVRCRALDDWACKALGEPTYNERNQQLRYAAELNKPAAERNAKIKPPAPRTPSGTVAINAQGEFKPAGRTDAIAGSDKSLAACAITRLTRRDRTHVVTPTANEQRNIDATARETRRQNEARRARATAQRSGAALWRSGAASRQGAHMNARDLRTATESAEGRLRRGEGTMNDSRELLADIHNQLVFLRKEVEKGREARAWSIFWAVTLAVVLGIPIAAVIIRVLTGGLL